MPSGLDESAIGAFIPSATLAERVSRAEGLLAGIGITPPPTGRFAVYAALVREWAAATGPMFTCRPELALAVEEMPDLCLVIEHFTPFAQDKAIERRLIEVVRKGAVWSTDKGSQSRARDFQWEMVLAASLARLGVAARLVDPPDLVVAWNGLELGVAAKRPKSQTTGGVLDCLRDGVEQVVRFGLPGVVAADLSVVAEFHNRPAQVASHAAAGRALDIRCAEAAQSILAAFDTPRRHPRLLGVLVRLHLTYRLAGDGLLATQGLWHEVTFGDGGAGANPLALLADGLRSRLNGLVE